MSATMSTEARARRMFEVAAGRNNPKWEDLDEGMQWEWREMAKAEEAEIQAMVSRARASGIPMLRRPLMMELPHDGSDVAEIIGGH